MAVTPMKPTIDAGTFVQLVLSTFPGIGLLDAAFERLGFSVVRGPDTLWGGDIHTFHVPAGRFDGVIGGPPCPAHSTMARIIRKRGNEPAPDLIPEFTRIIEEAQPAWYLMENVPGAPGPTADGYEHSNLLINNRCFGEEQDRKRRFYFGMKGKAINLLPHIDVELFENPTKIPTVMASGIIGPSARKRLGKKEGPSWATVRYSLAAQGLPEDLFTKANSVFTARGVQKMIGNGVPLPMGVAIAAAIKKVLEKELT